MVEQDFCVHPAGKIALTGRILLRVILKLTDPDGENGYFHYSLKSQFEPIVPGFKFVTGMLLLLLDEAENRLKTKTDQAFNLEAVRIFHSFIPPGKMF